MSEFMVIIVNLFAIVFLSKILWRSPLVVEDSNDDTFRSFTFLMFFVVVFLIWGLGIFTGMFFA